MPSTVKATSLSIAWTNPFSIGCCSIGSHIATVIAVNRGRRPIAIVKSYRVPVSYVLSCALPLAVSNNAVCERTDKACKAAAVFHIDGYELKICREVEAVARENTNLASVFLTEKFHSNVNNNLSK